VGAEVAAKAIGYGGLNGPSRTSLASMKKYGLIDSDDKTVRVSDLALRILHPANEREAESAVREAALKPELFMDLFHTHRDASDGALRSHLITKLGFSEVGAGQLIKAFRDSMSVAGLDKPESFPSEALQALDNAQAYDGHRVDYAPVVDSPRQPAPAFGEVRYLTDWNTPQTFSWPLAPGVTGEVRILGDAPKPQYLEAIRGYLELAKKLLKEDDGANPGVEGGTREGSI